MQTQQLFKSCLFALLSSLWGAAYADLPLTVEDLITDKGKIKSDISLFYANSDRQGVALGEPITVKQDRLHLSHCPPR
jgi:hypothetical protein